MLEPRRLAARMAAKRVADELGERVGETVGYQVRFDDVSSARTRIRFVTEGILTRRLVADPTLKGVGAVLLDEFHERHLHGDLALAMLRRLQRTTRPDLCVAAMSATLDGESVARFLGDEGGPSPRVRSEGRRFEVTLQHSPAKDDRPLSAQVASAVRALCDEGLDGDVLVFLPGAAEIRKAMGACTAVAQQHDLLVLPLHGELPPAEQDRAVLPAPKRKVILSTNVAETSVTIDGVVAVIDSGLARIAGHAAWSGLPTLREGRVSKASALQRAGRAGRTRPGRCVRLYTKHDHDTRPEFERAEVLRLDLAETALALHTAGERDLHAFPWFEAPTAGERRGGRWPAAAARRGDTRGGGDPEGRRMARLPLHPRLARLVLDATARGVGEDGCIVAALLGERELDTSRRGPGGRAVVRRSMGCRTSPRRSRAFARPRRSASTTRACATSASTRARRWRWTARASRWSARCESHAAATPALSRRRRRGAAHVGARGLSRPGRAAGAGRGARAGERRRGDAVTPERGAGRRVSRGRRRRGPRRRAQPRCGGARGQRHRARVAAGAVPRGDSRGRGDALDRRRGARGGRRAHRVRVPGAG